MSYQFQAPSATRKLIATALPDWSDIRRLGLINTMSGGYVLYLHHQTQGRISLLQKIKDCTEDGKVAIIVTSTDCDWTRATYCHLLDPAELFSYIDQLYEDAEGPTNWHIERPSDTKDFRSSSRDLALEAFEDGHPHLIYS